MRLLLILLVILPLAACQRSMHGLRAELDSGTAGYAGEVRSFSVPYLLRYEPTAKLNVMMRGIIKAPDGKESAISARGTLQIMAIGADRIMEVSVSEVDLGDKGSNSSSGAPLVAIRMLISSRGIAREIDVAFPAYVGRSDVPSRDSDAYKALVKGMKDTLTALPQDPVRMGDAIWSSQEMAEILLQDVSWPVQLPKTPRSNTLTAKIIGETVVDGRPHLVVEHSGGIDWTNADNIFSIGTKGYSLVDTRFGVMRQSKVAVTIFGRAGGKMLTSDVVFQRDISN